MNTPRSPDEETPLPNVDALLGRVVPRLKHLRDPEQRGDLTDAAASEALTLASMLFNALAGWARDHVIGRAINGISAAPYQSGTVRERNLGDDRPWDNPNLEQVGASYEFNDSRANKKLIIELLDPMDRALGTRLSSELIQAFEGAVTLIGF